MKDIYEEMKSRFLGAVDVVEVRVSQKYVPLKDQFLNNWDSCKEMWVACYRSALPTLGDNTNNSVERSFWTWKQSILDKFPSLPVIEQSSVQKE